MKKTGLIFLILLSQALLNCNKSDDSSGMACTEEFVYGLNITLKDTNDNIITTDVEVTATDGAYTETLTAPNGLTFFVGAGERPGIYVVTVTSPNYGTFVSDNIVVASNACHVIPVTREFTLVAD